MNQPSLLSKSNRSLESYQGQCHRLGGGYTKPVSKDKLPSAMAEAAMKRQRYQSLVPGGGVKLGGTFLLEFVELGGVHQYLYL